MWMDKVKETFSIITNVKVKKDWSNLKKGDKLYLMVPEVKDNTIYYNYQESEIIVVKEYSSITNVRFKYTYNGKRKRVNLAVNKLKYELPYLAITKATQWAREYKPVYGDTIVTFISAEQLNDIYASLIVDEINKQEQIIEDHKKMLNILRTMQYVKVV